ncbi:MAG: polysaccharide deacetylase family protein [Calditrichaeota bacterium]|nr:polysaccharide deacetylase family protein [Calditrichota bacterium]RQV93369.1 MAG: polysaccharide deacetylase family protein [bacterium]RQW05701.1 MAG: polysaccharide deacetylase family protein [Calditrichota bacterium]
MLTKYLSRIFLPPIENVIWQRPENGRNLYLTFDDGPQPYVTPAVLEILNSAKIPAVFFLSGMQLEKYEKDLPKLDYNSHEIANHGFSHTPCNLQSTLQVVREIEKTDHLIKRIFNRSTRLFRPPYGIWDGGLEKALKEQHKTMILWSLLSNDFKWPVSKILDFLAVHIEPGDIIVFHDSEQSSSTIVKVLPEFIDLALKMDFQFKSLHPLNGFGKS